MSRYGIRTRKGQVSSIIETASGFTVSTGSITWDSSNSSPNGQGYSSGVTVVTETHLGMKRCVVNDNGTVNYYLSATDSTKKADGTNATLTGADGQVMVEIPKFWTKRSVSGNSITWSIASQPLSGYTLHPAFTKDGNTVDFRYYGAYDGCYWDATDSTYKSGLNLDDVTSLLDLAADKLSSVSGVYPLVGNTRAQGRSLASNRGTFWRQVDFTLWSAVQLLYLIEYQTFYSQNVLGNGNTNVTNAYSVGSSSTQTDSPHSVAGKSNALGNGSTNTTSGASSTSRDTAYMSYRGIENFYGNCWYWVDGINANVGANGRIHVTNNRADFTDNSSTNMTLITSSATTGQNFISAIAAIDNYFIATAVAGSSTTYLTDYWYSVPASNRVVVVGGSAIDAANAGAFMFNANSDSSYAYRNIGSRLAG